jgi:hypothetical protein
MVDTVPKAVAALLREGIELVRVSSMGAVSGRRAAQLPDPMSRAVRDPARRGTDNAPVANHA